MPVGFYLDSRTLFRAGLRAGKDAGYAQSSANHSQKVLGSGGKRL
jgi:hypothetical protein